MPLTINGSVHPDGAPLTVGGEQVSEVTVNGGVVWVNNYAPSVITDFAATADELDQVSFTFSLADALPAATYDLYRAGVLVASGVSSGDSYIIEGPDTADYNVRATNSEGFADSNLDSGTSLPVFDPMLDTIANGAVGESLTDHVMDSGHRWSDAYAATDPALLSVYGTGPSGRMVGVDRDSGGAGALAGGRAIKKAGEEYPNKLRAVFRFEMGGERISVAEAVVGDTTLDDRAAIEFIGLRITEDPSFVALRIDGVRVWQTNTIDEGETYYYIETTLDVDADANTISGNVNMNGTNYAIPSHTVALDNIEALGFFIENGASEQLGGVVGISNFSVTELV